MESNKVDFTKKFFQTAWGQDGYFENFSYGVGIDKVHETCIHPFTNHRQVLEIGSGGGVFTSRLVSRFLDVTAIDVIKMPLAFHAFPKERFTYIELPNQNYSCKGVDNNSIDFAFSYNVFCHLSNTALTKYLKAVHRVLRTGGDFVFMLANYQYTQKHFEQQAHKYKLGDLTPVGHFYQNEKTLPLIADPNKWEVVNPNMIPEHRDLIIHLRKK